MPGKVKTDFPERAGKEKGYSYTEKNLIPDISVILPCRNEICTVALCVEKASETGTVRETSTASTVSTTPDSASKTAVDVMNVGILHGGAYVAKRH